ncbi:MAG: PTS fructose transporter subunit IIA [Ectothiorhodospiraceae bacterium]|jgi:PTS system ascorbate-specific IIA component
MSVGLLLITHHRIGEELLNTSRSILGLCPLRVAHLNVSQSDDPVEMLQRGRRMVQYLDSGDGVLILTDALGSTPSNVATRLGEQADISVVAGVNLPMLLRVLNYPDLKLAELQQKAVSGGRDGVLAVETIKAVNNERQQ